MSGVEGGKGRMGRNGGNLRKSTMSSILLVAIFIGAAGAGMSPPRVHVSTRSVSPASLPGELTMPRGSGPFPAVIILHGCQGIGPPVARDRLLEYTSWYADRGYVG